MFSWLTTEAWIQYPTFPDMMWKRSSKDLGKKDLLYARLAYFDYGFWESPEHVLLVKTLMLH